jgi:hypothetical protein
VVNCSAQRRLSVVVDREVLMTRATNGLLSAQHEYVTMKTISVMAWADVGQASLKTRTW